VHQSRPLADLRLKFVWTKEYVRSNQDRLCIIRRPPDLSPNLSNARQRRALVTAASRRRRPRWLSRESPNLTTGAKWCARQNEAIQGLTEDRGEVRGADHGPQRPGADLPRRRRIRGHSVANSARRAIHHSRLVQRTQRHLVRSSTHGEASTAPSCRSSPQRRAPMAAGCSFLWWRVVMVGRDEDRGKALVFIPRTGQPTPEGAIRLCRRGLCRYVDSVTRGLPVRS
jgi:hypothetical protein